MSHIKPCSQVFIFISVHMFLDIYGCSRLSASDFVLAPVSVHEECFHVQQTPSGQSFFMYWVQVRLDSWQYLFPTPCIRLLHRDAHSTAIHAS